MKMEDYYFVIHPAKNGKNIVFMDIKMSEMDKYDATKVIKKLNLKLPS